MRRKDLSPFEKASILQFLQECSKNGKPARGNIQTAILKFSSSRRTIGRLWAASKKQQVAGVMVSYTSGKINSSRRKRIEIDLDLIASLELCKRSIIRRLASGIQCSKGTGRRWICKGLIKAYTSAIKSDLIALNKLLRLMFLLEVLEYDRIMRTLWFKSMQNIVHIDEKWFYITKSSHRFYLTPGEAEPYSTCKSKKFITNVMFTCAACRPLFGLDENVLFDEKIGIFPFTEWVPAKRSSKNREANTLEHKSIASINKKVIKDCLIHKEIIPSIKSKWPAFANKNIYIQQNNFMPHIKGNDVDYRVAASGDGFNIMSVHQPPNLPDTNINDLGWFRAIQSIQIESVCFNVDSLVNAVDKSFQELTSQTLNKVFLSLQDCMIEMMKVKGQNCYNIPYMKKDALTRQGNLPLSLEFSPNLVREYVNYLVDKGIQGLTQVEDLSSQLGQEQAGMTGLYQRIAELEVMAVDL